MQVVASALCGNQINGDRAKGGNAGRHDDENGDVKWEKRWKEGVRATVGEYKR